MENKEAQNLSEEKQQLLRDIDNGVYKTDAEKEKALQRVGQLEKDIYEKAHRLLNKQLDVMPQKLSEMKIKEMRDIRKVLNDKYDEYVELRRKAENLLIHLREKTAEGRTLKEQVKGGNPTDDIPKTLYKTRDAILAW